MSAGFAQGVEEIYKKMTPFSRTFSYVNRFVPFSLELKGLQRDLSTVWVLVPMTIILDYQFSV